MKIYSEGRPGEHPVGTNLSHRVKWLEAHKTEIKPPRHFLWVWRCPSDGKGLSEEVASFIDLSGPCQTDYMLYTCSSCGYQYGERKFKVYLEGSIFLGGE